MSCQKQFIDKSGYGLMPTKISSDCSLNEAMSSFSPNISSIATHAPGSRLLP